MQAAAGQRACWWLYCGSIVYRRSHTAALSAGRQGLLHTGYPSVFCTPFTPGHHALHSTWPIPLQLGPSGHSVSALGLRCPLDYRSLHGVSMCLTLQDRSSGSHSLVPRTRSCWGKGGLIFPGSGPSLQEAPQSWNQGDIGSGGQQHGGHAMPPAVPGPAVVDTRPSQNSPSFLCLLHPADAGPR